MTTDTPAVPGLSGWGPVRTRSLNTDAKWCAGTDATATWEIRHLSYPAKYLGGGTVRFANEPKSGETAALEHIDAAIALVQGDTAGMRLVRQALNDAKTMLGYYAQ